MKTEDVRQQWEGAAPGWAKWENKIANLVEPATQAMLEMAHVGPGARVLDLACGAGSQTLAAAQLVGSEGHVMASDISGNMLQFVEERANKAQLGNISTQLGAAGEIDLPAESIDAVICRLGLMLFANPSRALDKSWKVLRPGGRMAAVVFTLPETNPFMAQPMQVLLRHTGKEPPAPGQPGIFSLGAPGLIEKLFSNNGFGNIEKRTFPLSLQLASASEALQMMQEAFGAYRAILKDSPETVRKAAWAEVEDTLRGFETRNGFEAPFEVMVAAGDKKV